MRAQIAALDMAAIVVDRKPSGAVAAWASNHRHWASDRHSIGAPVIGQGG